ncbi:MAG: cryptochrome/photolyase family protein [Bacteroidota bacterium]
MKKTVNLIFPHQLFKDSPLLANQFPWYMVEEWLFFKQYNFHKQKIAFHRASMKCYQGYLNQLGKKVHYIDATEEASDIRILIAKLANEKVNTLEIIAPTDNWLSRRVQKTAVKYGITIQEHQSPLFLNSIEDLGQHFKKGRKRYHQTKFYMEQRKERNILLSSNGKPVGDKWTFDTENRKKYPVKKTPPPVHYPKENPFYVEAESYVSKNFPNNLGELQKTPLYPVTFESSEAWLQQFLEYRFMEFGAYEDAIVAQEPILNHSVLTPMLNTGLLTPERVIKTSLAFAKNEGIPLNSLEGFVRQIIGWREFIRGIYHFHGGEERTKNFWGFKRKIPTSFYKGTTGIPPIDITIKKVLKTGYCHHIERLMVLGNFMMLCEFDPDEVYQWFMELFIDAYDWVMVPNIYGMSQFADGGLFATKPYISGSNYLMKMSNYKKGEWQQTWDGLFWRFMDVHRHFFLKNPRLGMLVRTFDKMTPEKKEGHMRNAATYLESLGAI